MKNLFFSIVSILGLSSCKSQEPLQQQSIYDFTMTSLTGQEISLSQYRGKVLLIVNVASKCGLTPQYRDLEALYQSYRDSGLVILGFPANNFLWQEPGTDQEIAEFCQINYGVSFPMFSKISVKGKNQHPLYQFLTQKQYNKLMDKPVSWNFQKFVIDRNGNVVDIINPKDNVSQPEILSRITKYL